MGRTKLPIYSPTKKEEEELKRVGHRVYRCLRRMQWIMDNATSPLSHGDVRRMIHPYHRGFNIHLDLKCRAYAFKSLKEDIREIVKNHKELYNG